MNKPTSELSNKELREFGLIFGIIFALLFGLLLPWLFSKAYPVWPWWVLAVSAGLALIIPVSLKPFFKVWMLFGAVMGWINTRLILGIVFYLVFMPFGLVMKLFGKDFLSIKLDRSMNSYRVIHSDQIKSSMENPY